MTTATKTKLKIFPLADRVAIRPLEDTEEMKGGLYIPDTAKEKPIQGDVIAVGPGRLERGQRVPMDLKVGDRDDVTLDRLLLGRVRDVETPFHLLGVFQRPDRHPIREREDLQLRFRRSSHDVPALWV